MHEYPIIVIGGSAGAISTAIEIIKDLPSDFPTAILLVIHISPTAKSVLPEILSRKSRLLCVPAKDGDHLLPAKVYIAPPDHHLMVYGDQIRLTRGPRENYHRPSIDTLFRSAAVSFPERVIAVLLSGYLDDGVAGLIAVRRRGGVVIVQDPNSTHYPDLPRNALQHIHADAVLPANEIAAAIMKHLQKGGQVSRTDEHEAAMLAQEMKMEEIHSGKDVMEQMPGKPSKFTCPECRGALWELDDHGLLRYRCHEGHAYSEMTMHSGQNEALELALWTALRTIDENGALAKRLRLRAEQKGQTIAAERFHESELKASEQAALIRRALSTD